MRALATATAGILLAALASASLAARAQSSGPVPRIGVIGERSVSEPFLEAFRQGFRDLGSREGENIVEHRFQRGALDRAGGILGEAIRLDDVMAVLGGKQLDLLNDLERARALGPRVPQSVLLRADRVVE